MAPGISQYTPVDTALAQVMGKIQLNRRAEVLPSRLAYGRVSAEEVLAPADIPPFPISHWDGFAAISDDLKGASDSNPISLKVVGRAAPGARTRASMGHGEAVQVATGAPLPVGADTVVPVESVETEGTQAIVRTPSPARSHVYATGEDVRRGETILRKGQAIRAQDVGLLVSMGLTKVRAWRRPTVSILSTGDELADAAARPRAGRVVDSHGPLFLRLVEELGCIPIDLGIAGDAKARIAMSLRTAMIRSDFVLTLGGTSAGRHDYVATAVASLGPEVLVHGIKMDRGRVSGIAVLKGKPVLMMPGPIQAAMNAFLLLGIPIIEVLSGAKGKGTELSCAFSEAWDARARYADFRKVIYVKLEGGPRRTVKPLGAETESMRLLAEADGFVVVPENVDRIEAGERVTVHLLPGFSFA